MNDTNDRKPRPFTSTEAFEASEEGEPICLTRKWAYKLLLKHVAGIESDQDAFDLLSASWRMSLGCPAGMWDAAKIFEVLGY